MLADLARKVAGGDLAALVPLHAAVLTELESRPLRCIADMVCRFDLSDADRQPHLTRAHYEIEFVRYIYGGQWPRPPMVDPDSLYVVALHLAAVMVACAYDERRAKQTLENAEAKRRCGAEK